MDDVKGLSEDQISKKKAELKLSKIIDSIREYVDWNFFALFFSGALLLQLVYKITYNVLAK